MYSLLKHIRFNLGRGNKNLKYGHTFSTRLFRIYVNLKSYFSLNMGFYLFVVSLPEHGVYKGNFTLYIAMNKMNAIGNVNMKDI